MKAKSNVPHKNQQIETENNEIPEREDDNGDFEREEIEGEFHDAIGRAHAILMGASAIGGMARLSRAGVDCLRRLVFAAEGAVNEAYDLARDRMVDDDGSDEEVHNG